MNRVTVELLKPHRIRGAWYKKGDKINLNHLAGNALVLQKVARVVTPQAPSSGENAEGLKEAQAPSETADKEPAPEGWAELRALPHDEARAKVEEITGNPSPRGWDALKAAYAEHLASPSGDDVVPSEVDVDLPSN